MATSIEDTLTRWHRMNGERSLFNPGCDHAGIATQVVVEKKLWREKQLTRHDVGREKFVEHVWKWKEEKGMTIYEQLKALGSSVDWDRACFTMDPKMCTAVTEAFVRLHESGLIYRSTRLVNWSCALRSAISDIEVDKRELAGRMMLSVPGYDHKVEFGVLVSFAYPIYNSDEEVVVATTRVETMLGDTAVAVHPDDHRYRHLIGRLCKHPFVDRDLPIVADAFVDKDFGTGCVKVTPAHDHNDYEVGLRHKLPFVTCIGDDGLMTKHCGPFSGLPRFEARKRVLEALKQKALYRDCVDNPMVVPICNRSKDVVEPMLKPQWYVDCQQMAKRAIEVVNSGELTLIPDFHVKTWITWMEGIRDWCISRQLWWGHRIPAYFVESKNLAIPNGDAADSNYWVSGRTVEEAVEKAAQRFNIAKENIVLKQDEDVLDTWFSSALFPFSVFDWPNGGKSFDVHYPTNVLETAHDILFFWVARMVFFGQELTGKLPFKQVYLHPIIRDAHGRKMSKSLGNVIDPIDVVRGVTLAELYRKLEDGNLDPREVEMAKAGQKKDFPDGIPECGTDALRFALLAYTGQGRDINLDVLRIQGYRHFSNKIWQGTRFVLNQLGKDYQPCREFALSGCESAPTCWIAGRMSLAVRLTNEALNAFNFTAATTAVYNFWLYDFCDVYLEYAKAVIQQSDNYYAKEQCRQMLFSCVDCGLRLISPFMPYLSEELWQRLPRRDKALTEPSICVESYPSVGEFHYEDVKLFDRVDLAMSIVRTIRSLRSDYELTAKTKTDLFVECVDKGTLAELGDLVELIRTLTATNHLTLFAVGKQKAPLGCAIVTVSASCKAHLFLQGIIDLEKEMKKLNEQKAKVAGQLGKLEESMTKSDYEVKVPLPVRTANTEKVLHLFS